MRFRRRVEGGEQWVAVVQSDAVLHAAQISLGPDRRPRLGWIWQGPSPELSQGLRSLNRAHRLKGAKLTGQIERTQYRLISTEVPDVPRDEWRDAMRWRLKDQVDFPLDDAFLDVLAVPQDTQLRQMHPAMAVVAQRVDFNRMALAADDVGLSWSAVDVPETALCNLSALAETPEQAHALMVFGDAHGMLVITYKGELLMTRNIEVAVSAVTGSQEARGAALGRAALEVLRTLDTFERMHSQVTLSGLSVVPPEGGEDVLEVLADLVYVPVKSFELKSWMDLAVPEDQGMRLAATPSLDELCAIGAALRGHRQALGLQSLSLVDEASALTAPPTWNAVWGLRIAAVVGGGACAVGAVMSTLSAAYDRQAEAFEADVVALRQEVGQQTVPPEFKQLSDLRAQEERQRHVREALASSILPQTALYSDYLIALARQSQPGLWITELNLRGQGSDLELSGRMLDPAQLPSYLGRLEQEPQFKGRRFAQVEMRSLETPEGVGPSPIAFTLRGQLPKA
ncbi:MAG TPA: PilN domain-containing protein, partial [Aquabacterium sp.]|nr:PilN domain-containing protein [Aquabacterium sp.]